MHNVIKKKISISLHFWEENTNYKFLPLKNKE
jgi:hypothetical protein